VKSNRKTDDSGYLQQWAGTASDMKTNLKKAKFNSPEPMNIGMVARAANVSIATVSRTINGLSTVNPDIAERVWKVINRLGYFPNTQARALVSGRSRIFGLIVSEITNPFFPELIQGFEDVAVEHGYEILVSSPTMILSACRIAFAACLSEKSKESP